MFVSVSGWGDSSEAAISFSAEFFAPEIAIVPLSGTPPVIAMRSI